MSPPMTQPDLARLEGLVELAAEDGFTPEIEQQFMDELPALLARVRELREALERIASEHIRLPDEPTGTYGTETAMPATRGRSPKRPSTRSQPMQDETKAREVLALHLIAELGQQSASIQTPDKTVWSSFREEGL